MLSVKLQSLCSPIEPLIGGLIRYASCASLEDVYSGSSIEPLIGGLIPARAMPITKIATIEPLIGGFILYLVVSLLYFNIY